LVGLEAEERVRKATQSNPMTQEQRKIAESAYSKVTIALEELMQPVMNPAYRINESRQAVVEAQNSLNHLLDQS
jgi:hypothetical protein